MRTGKHFARLVPLALAFTLWGSPGPAAAQSPAEAARTKVDQEWEQMQARHRAGQR